MTDPKVEEAELDDEPDDGELALMQPYPNPEELDGNQDSSHNDPPADDEVVPDVRP